MLFFVLVCRLDISRLFSLLSRPPPAQLVFIIVVSETMIRRFVGHHLLQTRCTCLQLSYCGAGVHYSSSLSAQQPGHVNITFLTDVEGDGDYFDRWVKNSKILGFQSRMPCFDSSHPVKWNLGQCDEGYFPYDRQVVFLEDDGMLVYGVSSIQYDGLIVNIYLISNPSLNRVMSGIKVVRIYTSFANYYRCVNDIQIEFTF